MSCQGKIQRWQVKKIFTRSTEHLGCRGTHCWVSLCFYVSYLWKAPGSLVFEMCCHAWGFGHVSSLIIDNDMEEPWKLSNSDPTLGPKSQSLQGLPYRAAAITLFALARRGRRGTNLTGCGMVRPLPQAAEGCGRSDSDSGWMLSLTRFECRVLQSYTSQLWQGRIARLISLHINRYQ